MKSKILALVWLVFIALLCVERVAHCDDVTSGEKLLNFSEHVQPIFEKNCLQCHGAGEAKGGLRIDQLESLQDYLQPGDADASSLWTDYLRTDDPDMLMPPASATHPGGLTATELVLVRTWINEGAEGEWTVTEVVDSKQPEAPAVPQSTIGKFWAFQGLFHPAAVHLPVALLAVSSLFVFFSFFNRSACEPVAYHCLWIGALGAVAACLTGWSYAFYEGYGSGFSFDLEGKAIDRHRWLGVFVAVFALITVPLGRSVRRHGEINKRIVWLLAGVVLMAGVSVAGFQGGELHYGEGHYEKYYQQLFGKTELQQAPVQAESTASESTASEAAANEPTASEPPNVEAPPTEAPPTEAPPTEATPTEAPPTETTPTETPVSGPSAG